MTVTAGQSLALRWQSMPRRRDQAPNLIFNQAGAGHVGVLRTCVVERGSGGGGGGGGRVLLVVVVVVVGGGGGGGGGGAQENKQRPDTLSCFPNTHLLFPTPSSSAPPNQAQFQRHKLQPGAYCGRHDVAIYAAAASHAHLQRGLGGLQRHALEGEVQRVDVGADLAAKGLEHAAKVRLRGDLEVHSLLLQGRVRRHRDGDHVIHRGLRAQVGLSAVGRGHGQAVSFVMR